MKNMSPDEIKNLMQQAQGQQSMMEDMVKKLVQEEIKNQNLVSRAEVEKMIKT